MFSPLNYGDLVGADRVELSLSAYQTLFLPLKDAPAQTTGLEPVHGRRVEGLAIPWDTITPCLQSTRREIRTPDPLHVRQLLVPTELCERGNRENRTLIFSVQN